MVIRVSLKGLYGSVSRQDLSWGGPNTAQWTVRGDHKFGGTVDSVTVHVCVHVTNPAERRTGACSRELNA